MSALALDVAVLGVGLWADGLGTWDEGCAHWRGDAQGGQALVAAPARPQTTLLPPAERRRAPATVLLALAVAEQACRQTGLDPRAMRSVFTSSHGDLELTDYLCATLAESPEHLSPTKFHHSVHNAASGYWTIGVGNRQASTAISAGPQSFAQGLIEAATQVVCEHAPVLLVAYDMPASGPLVRITRSTALVGLALVLAPIQCDRSHPSLALRMQAAAPPDAQAQATTPEIEALLPGSPMAVGLPLARALALIDPQAGIDVETRFMLSPTRSLSVTLAGRKRGDRR